MNHMKKRVLYSREEINGRVQELADMLSREYEGKDLVLVGILKGAFIFLSDLVRSMGIPHQIDFIRVASYGSGTVSSGKITITKDLECSIEGKDVLIVEDIIDTGTTLASLKTMLGDRKPASLKICALVDKTARREVEIDADYVGFTMEDGFVVGYGLDCNEQFRSLPEIYVIEE
ncbi:MAG: hypoxanthine phosphoribosyltransferase [Deltaproteobacteria bacterium]|nr:hypoxanthine phosphoribosyltransferase [Deltaproteobacteria bacterium]MBN2688824.1 hypoxanthine phosphoribosyltransferase [Deltaproteobacteria bacterium]